MIELFLVIGPRRIFLQRTKGWVRWAGTKLGPREMSEAIRIQQTSISTRSHPVEIKRAPPVRPSVLSSFSESEWSSTCLVALVAGDWFQFFCFVVGVVVMVMLSLVVEIHDSCSARIPFCCANAACFAIVNADSTCRAARLIGQLFLSIY